jgi:hypothetical protein
LEAFRLELELAGRVLAALENDAEVEIHKRIVNGSLPIGNKTQLSGVPRE